MPRGFVSRAGLEPCLVREDWRCCIDNNGSLQPVWQSILFNRKITNQRDLVDFSVTVRFRDGQVQIYFV